MRQITTRVVGDESNKDGVDDFEYEDDDDNGSTDKGNYESSNEGDIESNGDVNAPSHSRKVMQTWVANMQALRAKTEEGYVEMMAMPGKFWTQAFVETFSFCERVDNNMCECFNSKILKPRCLPIISMLRNIEKYCLEKRRDSYIALKDWDNNISPSAKKMLDVAIDKGGKNNGVWNGFYEFQVDDGKFIHVVNFLIGECTCRVWQLTGIPCQHVVCGARSMKWELETFVSDYFKKDKYIAAWSQPLEFSRGPEMWKKKNSSVDEILPPPMKTILGRPKRNRRKSNDEPKKSKKGKAMKMSRSGKPVTCSSCGVQGHNKRGCPRRSTLPLQTASSQAKRKRSSGLVINEGGQQQQTKRHETARYKKAGYNTTTLARIGGA